MSYNGSQIAQRVKLSLRHKSDLNSHRLYGIDCNSPQAITYGKCNCISSVRNIKKVSRFYDLEMTVTQQKQLCIYDQVHFNFTTKRILWPSFTTSKTSRWREVKYDQ